MTCFTEEETEAHDSAVGPRCSWDAGHGAGCKPSSRAPSGTAMARGSDMRRDPAFKEPGVRKGIGRVGRKLQDSCTGNATCLNYSAQHRDQPPAHAHSSPLADGVPLQDPFAAQSLDGGHAPQTVASLLFGGCSFSASPCLSGDFPAA